MKTDKLGILPGLIEPDVLQAVTSFPGVISVDESISNINIRGGTHDQNLILFDGIRMYISGHFFGLISAFNPHLNYDITLSKSGSSAKYGEGVSGVIDMKLPDEVVDKSSYGIGFNLINVDGMATLATSKNTTLQIATRRSITDFINTPTYNAYFKRAFQDSDLLKPIINNNSVLAKDENFKFHDVYSKFIWNISKNDKLKIVFLNIDNDLTYNETLSNVLQNESSASRLNQQNISSGITYEKNWNSRLKIAAQKYFTFYNLSSKNADIINNQTLIQENEIQDNGLKLEANYTFNDTSSLLTGYQYSQVAISNLEEVDNPSFRRYIKQVLVTHSLFSQFNYASHKVNLKAGIRANYFDKFKRFIVVPRLTFNYKFYDNFRLLLTGELKSQAITQIIDLQDDFLGVEKRRWILANESTNPIITSNQFSAGIFYKKNGLLISAETYIKNVSGISSRSQGFQNQFQFQNDVGDYRVKGIDFMINKKFRNINTWISYSYNINNYTFKNLNNSNSFPNNVDIQNVLNIAATYTHKNLKFGLGLNWHTGKPFTEVISINERENTIEYALPNNARISDYLRLDTSMNYQFSIGKANAICGLSIWSILDKKNILNVYHEIQGTQISRIENTSLRFTPNISFRIKL